MFNMARCFLFYLLVKIISAADPNSEMEYRKQKLQEESEKEEPSEPKEPEETQGTQ